MTPQDRIDVLDRAIDELRQQLAAAEREDDADLIDNRKEAIREKVLERDQLKQQLTIEPIRGPVPVTPIPSEPKDFESRFHDALRVNQFPRADFLLQSADVDEAQREALLRSLETAIHAYRLGVEDEVLRAIAEKRFAEADGHVDRLIQATGEDQDSAVRLRKIIAESKAKSDLRTVVQLLNLSVDEKTRARQPEDPRIARIIAGLNNAAQAELLSRDLVEEISKTEEAWREEERLKAREQQTRFTRFQTRRFKELLRDVKDDKSREIHTVIVPLEIDGQQAGGSDSIQEGFPLPVDEAIELYQRKVIEEANSEIRSKIQKVRLLQISNLPQARSVLDAARREFASDADVSHREALDTCDDDLRERERIRATHNADLEAIERGRDIVAIAEAIRTVKRAEPTNPNIDRTVDAVVTRFRGQIAAQIGRAIAQPADAAKLALDGISRQLQALAELAPIADVSTDEAAPVELLQAQVARAVRDVEATIAQQSQLVVARSQLADWLRANPRDGSRGPELVSALAHDSSAEALELLERARPLLDVDAKFEAAWERLAGGDIDAAQRFLDQLRGGQIAASRINDLEAAIARHRDAQQVRQLLSDSNEKALREAERLLSRLKTGAANGDRLDANEIARFREEVDRRVSQVDRARATFSAARADIQNGNYERARNGLDSLVVTMVDLDDEKQRLVAEVGNLWQTTVREALAVGVAAGDADQVCGALEVFRKQFAHLSLDHELSHRSFETLARTWERPGAHIEVLHRAVAAAKTIRVGPEQRDRLASGVRQLAERSDIPAIQAALAQGDGGRAGELLAKLDPELLSPSLMVPLWVELYVLQRNFDAARTWLRRLEAGQDREALERGISAREEQHLAFADRESRLERNITELQGNPDRRRVESAYKDAELIRASLGQRSEEVALRSKWDSALREFVDKQSESARRELASTTPHRAIEALTLLLAVNRLNGTALQLEYDRLVADLRGPVHRVLGDVNLLLSSPVPDRVRIPVVEAEIRKQLAQVAMIGAAGAGNGDRNSLNRALEQLTELDRDCAALETAKALFGQRITLVRAEPDLTELGTLLRGLPVRFTGYPQHPIVRGMTDEFQSLQREWTDDNASVEAMRVAWDRRDYRTAELLAGTAANDVRLHRDRFKRKENIEVAINGRQLRGAAEIRTVCTQKLALINAWERYLDDVRGRLPSDNEISILRRDFDAKHYVEYDQLRRRISDIQGRFASALRPDSEPRDQDRVLIAGDITSTQSDLASIRQKIDEHQRQIVMWIEQLDSEARAAADLEKRLADAEQEVQASISGMPWNRKPSQEAVRKLESVRAEYKRIRPGFVGNG